MSMSLNNWIRRTAVALGLCALGTAPQAQLRLGGCETTELEYGLEALSDSLALSALGELLRPGSGPKGGPHCLALGVESPLFFQIGGFELGEREHWLALARQVTDCLTESGLYIAERSRLKHTTGTCFPPFHVDFRAVGATAVVDSLLECLATLEWEGFVPVQDRPSRTHFLSAGRSLQLTEVVVDLQIVG